MKCVSSFFSKEDAFVGTIITADDSTMRNRLKQNGRGMVEAGVVSCVRRRSSQNNPSKEELRSWGTQPGHTCTCLQSKRLQITEYMVMHLINWWI